MTQEQSISSQDVDPLQCDPAQLAAVAHLVYVNDDDPGFRRKPWGRGFTYLDAAGDHVQDPELRARFAALAIPPAWTDVWICTTPHGHIQATGRDEAGRKQYIYHPRWEDVRDRVKFERLLPFGEALPHLRQRVDADLRQRKLSHDKVVALVVRLLDETLIRIGNPTYARLHGQRFSHVGGHGRRRHRTASTGDGGQREGMSAQRDTGHQDGG